MVGGTWEQVYLWWALNGAILIFFVSLKPLGAMQIKDVDKLRAWLLKKLEPL
jgi:hypothetical protein